MVEGICSPKRCGAGRRAAARLRGAAAGDKGWREEPVRRTGEKDGDKDRREERRVESHALLAVR
ncbi:hypothetical protein E0L17_01895 [Olsenella sp. SW781]|uniref:hypothetical protein n=1 Tax=Olsenella sp. SW781 TaxID=2530046 RepID=UPI00143A5866|nr:hypothetical protein [Olsenella sp. SW781]NJE80085.1 hypothetical protein [Olsenella sp. SW781]